MENLAELDKVIAAVPGLESDEIAIAFISKPDLFTQMDDPKTCRQVEEKKTCNFYIRIWLLDRGQAPIPFGRSTLHSHRVS